MKRQKCILLLAAFSLGSLLMLSGCGKDNTHTEANTPAISEEAPEAEASDFFQIHSRWYQKNGAPLTFAVVTYYDGEKEIYQGTTNEDGHMTAFTLPANRTLTCVAKDSMGSELASSKMIYKYSKDISSAAIYPVHEDTESKEQLIELPITEIDYSAALFLTEQGTISHASMCPYSEAADTGAANSAVSGDEAVSGDAAVSNNTAE